MTIHDQMLEWFSEVGSGRWSHARDTIGALKATHPNTTQKAWLIADALECSGHLDIDWDADRWSVATPALCLLPGTSLCAVWTGARPRRYQQRLREDVSELTSVYDFEVPQPAGPTAIFVKGRAVADLEATATALGLSFVVNPALALASALPGLQPLTQAAASPAPFEEVKRFDAEAGEWHPERSRAARAGLHEVERRGQRQAFWVTDDGSWWRTDRAEGLFRAAATAGKTSLLWWSRAVDGAPSELRLRRPYLLPKLAKRAAVASSGLLPLSEGEWTVYRNVQEPVAQRIATATGQRLQTI